MNPDHEASAGQSSNFKGKIFLNEVEVEHGVQYDRFVIHGGANRKSYAKDDTADLVETAREENYCLKQERLLPEIETKGAGANDALGKVERPQKEASTGEEDLADPRFDHDRIDAESFTKDTADLVKTAREEDDCLVQERLRAGANDALGEVEHPQKEASTGKEDLADPRLDHDQIDAESFTKNTADLVETA
jgi:hypothetical protein